MSGRGSRAVTPALLALAISGAAPAQTVNFDPAVAQGCLDRGEAACIGEATEACVRATPGGASTVGYALCTRAELTWWDDRLNAAYQRMLVQARGIDAQSSSYGTPNRPSDEAALRAMQRAWIVYRDATCGYEELQWWGGTGAHGAGLACAMRLTGAQTLYLQSLVF